MISHVEATFAAGPMRKVGPPIKLMRSISMQWLVNTGDYNTINNRPCEGFVSTVYRFYDIEYALLVRKRNKGVFIAQEQSELKAGAVVGPMHSHREWPFVLKALSRPCNEPPTYMLFPTQFQSVLKSVREVNPRLEELHGYPADIFAWRIGLPSYWTESLSHAIDLSVGTLLNWTN